MKTKFGKLFLAILIVSLLSISMLGTISNILPLANAQNASGSTISPSRINDIYATPVGNNSRSFFGSGPGVTTPNLLWTAHIPGAFDTNGMSAFGGYVFVLNGTHTLALDGGTGNIVYAIPNALSTPIYLGGNYMLIGNDAYKVDTGEPAWTAPDGFSTPNSIMMGYGIANEGGASALVTDPEYLPAPMFFNNHCGWTLDDPSKAPTVLWNDTGKDHVPQTALEAVYGNGVMVYNGPMQTFEGYNASTGAFLWSVPVTSQQGYGPTSTMGVFAWGSDDGTLYGWNITTGELLYKFTPQEPNSMWSLSLGSAYGLIYGHNQNQFFYAINATTGELVWKQNSPGDGIGYSGVFTTSGGYIYASMGEKQYSDPNTGKYGNSVFNCYDAYNGSLIWSLPIEDGSPFDQQCPAYGNLYMILTTTTPPTNASQVAYTYPFVSTGTVIALGPGPAQNYPMALNDPEHTSSGWGPTHLTKLWSKGWGDGGYLRAAPSFANGIGYVGSSDHNIYAFNASNGDEIWNFTTDNNVESTPAFANGYVYTGADDGTVYCLNAATGSKVWSTPLATDNPPILNSIATGAGPSPIVIGNELYIAANNYLYCLNAATGAVQWQFTWGDAWLLGTPTIVNHVVYIAPNQYGPNGYLYELDANTGVLINNITIPFVPYPYTGDFFGGILAPVTVDSADNLAFVQQTNQRTFAINLTSGTILWTYDAYYNPTSFQWGATNSDGVLYYNGQIYFNSWYSIVAVNALTGDVTWNTYLGREADAALSISFGNIYTCSSSQNIYVLNALTGAKESFAPSGGAQLFPQPVPYDGKLYIASGNFNVTCFGEAVVPTVATTDITFELRPSTIAKGDVVTVAGSINGVSSAVPLSVYFSRGDSSVPVNISAVTDGNGGFTVKYIPEMIGEWSVVVSYAGDATHIASSSQIQTFTVTETATPANIQVPQSAADLYFIPAIVGVIVAIVVVGAVLALLVTKKP